MAKYAREYDNLVTVLVYAPDYLKSLTMRVPYYSTLYNLRKDIGHAIGGWYQRIHLFLYQCEQ